MRPDLFKTEHFTGFFDPEGVVARANQVLHDNYDVNTIIAEHLRVSPQRAQTILHLAKIMVDVIRKEYTNGEE